MGSVSSIGSSFYWNDQALKAKMKAAGRLAALDVRMAAAVANPAPSKIKIVGPMTGFDGNSYIVAGKGPLAHIFEGGRKGGYIISPGDTWTHQLTARTYTSRKTGITTSKFGTQRIGGKGNFGQALSSQNTHPSGGGLTHPVSGPIFGGPMEARPYMAPAAELFPLFYRRRAAAAAGSGFARMLGVAA